MVDFAGYNMPVQYIDGVIVEHNTVRNAVGFLMFSHGRSFVSGESYF